MTARPHVQSFLRVSVCLLPKNKLWNRSLDWHITMFDIHLKRFFRCKTRWKQENWPSRQPSEYGDITIQVIIKRRERPKVLKGCWRAWGTYRGHKSEDFHTVEHLDKSDVDKSAVDSSCKKHKMCANQINFRTVKHYIKAALRGRTECLTMGSPERLERILTWI